MAGPAPSPDPTNIGLCCNSYAVACLDTTLWVKTSGHSADAITLTITFANHTDATTYLGAYSFTSTSNTTIAACLANLVSQINAAVQYTWIYTNPASLIAGQLCIISFPTPSDNNQCGNNTEFTPGISITCNQPTYVSLLPNTTADFTGGGNPVPCCSVSVSSNFVPCSGSYSLILYFSHGVPVNNPPNLFNMSLSNGWVINSTTIISPTALQVNITPQPGNSTLAVYVSGAQAGGCQILTAFIPLINDCFISQCASAMMLSQFCNDQNPCCVECDDYEKAKKKEELKMYNKAIALLTTYSMAKMNYFMTCNASDLIVIQNLLSQISSILIACNICPKI